MEPTPPLQTTLLYIGWSIDLHLRGPFVQHSAVRRDFLSQVRPLVSKLVGTAENLSIRLMETTFVPPLKGHPEVDVVLLADGDEAEIHDLESALSETGLPRPALTSTAENPVRFGDTDRAEGPVLLNHFASAANRERTIEVWKSVSQWYGSVLGVTNSTLLSFRHDSPYVVMNYAVIPTSVVRFMLNQMVRPSFYRTVPRGLSRIGARSLPIFARRIYSEIAS